jgi:hypothetical protein
VISDIWRCDGREILPLVAELSVLPAPMFIHALPACILTMSKISLACWASGTAIFKARALSPMPGETLTVAPRLTRQDSTEHRHHSNR